MWKYRKRIQVCKFMELWIAFIFFTSHRSLSASPDNAWHLSRTVDQGMGQRWIIPTGENTLHKSGWWAGCARSSRSWCKQWREVPDGRINDGSWQTTALPSWKAYIKARSLAGEATWCPTTLWVCGREVLAAVSPPQSWYPMDAPASCALDR